jgi:primosomal protein N' (replication factor Y)
VGRSGRSAKAGEAIIQTYNPSHYAIVYGARQDYESFSPKEMQERKIAQYPPYVILILARIRRPVE